MNNTPALNNLLIYGCLIYQTRLFDESNSCHSFGRLSGVTVQANQQVIYAKISKNGG
jgi:hypothetical protein